MYLAALTLIAIGVLLTVGGAFVPFDFAIAVRKGWHVTVFPSPFIGVPLIIIGIVALLASSGWR